MPKHEWWVFENQIEAECARAVSDLLEYEAREESNCESGTNESMIQDIDVNEAIWIDDKVLMSTEIAQDSLINTLVKLDTQEFNNIFYVNMFDDFLSGNEALVINESLISNGKDTELIYHSTFN